MVPEFIPKISFQNSRIKLFSLFSDLHKNKEACSGRSQSSELLIADPVALDVSACVTWQVRRFTFSAYG